MLVQIIVAVVWKTYYYTDILSLCDCCCFGTEPPILTIKQEEKLRREEMKQIKKKYGLQVNTAQRSFAWHSLSEKR